VSQTTVIPRLEPVEVVTPMTMIDKALDRQVSVDVIDRLMTLQERYDATRQKAAFIAARSEAKAKISETPIVKNRKGHNDKRYADFEAYAKVIDPVLSEHGLSYGFETQQDDKTIRVTCVLSHRDGHETRNMLAGPADMTGNKNAIQAIGSTVTYLSRYTLMAALGLAASDDDDGRKVDPRDEEPISDEQVERLQQAATETNTSLQKLCNMLGVAALKDLRPEGYNRARDILDERKRAQAKAPR
jgi:hypothetical protein